MGSHKAFNGYHLLNEVSTGGTLSSLFSILNLFTEDIKLAWDTPSLNEEDEDLAEHQSDSEDDDDVLRTRGVKKSRANSDVSQLDVGMSVSPDSISSEQIGGGDGRSPRPRSNSLGSTVRDESTSRDRSTLLAQPNSSSVPVTTSTSPILSPALSHPHLASVPFPSSPAAARTRHRSAPGRRGSTRMPDLPLPPKRTRAAPPTGAAALQGTIARATVDTTLAVIPAEAFRRMTRKYPKASGTVVQVVLERFSRVTFMTGEYSCEEP